MITYGFTLQLEGIDHDGFESFTEAIYGLANDCTASFCEGIAYAGFDRDASTLREAVASAVESVHRADPTVTIVGVVLDDGQPIDDLLGIAAA